MYHTIRVNEAVARVGWQLQVRCVSQRPREVVATTGSIETTEYKVWLDFAEGEVLEALVNPNIGCWPSYAPLNISAGVTEIDCEPISSPRRFDWWHEAVGISLPRPGRGRGMTIGVIDVGLDPDLPLPEAVEDLGHATRTRWQGTPDIIHGAVCASFIAANGDEDPIEGIAPGSTVYFMAAQERFSSDRMSPTAVAQAIRQLAAEECDLISISAGDTEKEQQLVREAVKDARRMGSLCLFAAGNSSGPPQYPACYEEIIAIGAFGRFGAQPENSILSRSATAPAASNERHFMLSQLAFGDLVNAAGPGIGIVAPSEHAGLNRVLTGTSYACPIVVGALAVLLSDDDRYQDLMGEARADYARTILLRRSPPLELGDGAAHLVCPRC